MINNEKVLVVTRHLIYSYTVKITAQAYKLKFNLTGFKNLSGLV
jgi:hypothetical protein